MKRRFKTGQDLADFVKQQINEEITLERVIKPRKGIVYMEIPDKTVIWSFLHTQGIKVEKHLKDGYFIHLV